MNIKILNKLDEYIALEELRYSVLGMSDKVSIDNYYIRKIIDKEMIPFALYNGNELVAGCYVSDARDSLYVDYLFVKKEYQARGLKLGRMLLQYIMDNKKIVEEFFGKEMLFCYLEPRGEKNVEIFSEMGFKNSNNVLSEYRKRI